MELRFDTMFYSNTGNENSDAGCIWPAGRRFPTPAVMYKLRHILSKKLKLHDK